MIIYSLKTNSFWQEKYSYRNIRQNITLILIVDIGILMIYFINHYCGNVEIKDLYNDSLVKALSRGEVSISNTPDNTELEKLNNPYDEIERGKLSRDTDYIWDAAYYNQKYYVYFGAVPALLIMVPFYLIKGKLLSTATTTLLFSLLSIIVLVIITKKVFQKYFEDLPFKYMALSSFIMMFGTCLIWINVSPRFYELVTVAGFFFAILGFLLIFDCEEEDKISYKKMFFGCLSLAVAVGCRPTQIFASLLVVPILLKIFIKNIKEKKNILKNILVVSIPYIAIAIFLMRYNYIRFGSPFEFGEKYQLTVNNMKDLTLRWITLPTGLLCSLFGLPTFQAVFPFLQANGNIIDTFSYFYVEDMPGGVFWFSPIAFFCFGIFWLWKKRENKNLKIFATSLLFVGLVFASFISVKAGNTGRYLLDFAWLYVLCGIVLFMEILKSLKTDEGKRIFGKIFNVIFVFTLIINLLSGFSVIGGGNSMKNNSPKQYYNCEYTIMFLK